MRLGQVQRGEWRWVSIFATLVMALMTAPYVLGWAAAGDDWSFSGFLFGVEDGNSYIAKMLRGAHGAWLFKLSYTVEPHPPALMFPFHILLGKATGALVGSGDPLRLHAALLVAYHAARVACGMALLAVSYRFLAEFLRAARFRRIGLALVALGGGLGWLLALLRAPGLPLEFYSPEAFTFLDLYGLPHLAAARALLLAGLICYWSALRSGHMRRAWGASALWLGVALIQPFYAALLYLLLALHYLCLRIVGARMLARRALRAAPAAGLLSLPVVVYTIILFQTAPIYRQWSRQNLILSPPPWQYLAAWGLLLLPGLFGLRPLFRRNLIAWAWVLVWLLALPALLYAPYNLQRRASEAVQLPLVALALLGLTVGVAPWLRGRARRQVRVWGPLGLLGVLLPTNLLLLAGGVFAALRPAEPVFLPRAQAALFACMARALPAGAPVLSSYAVGNALPAYAPLVAFIGHGPETAFLDEKRRVVEAFYGSASAAGSTLRRWRIEYFVYGPREAGLARAGPATHEFASAARAICDGDGYAVYTMNEDIQLDPEGNPGDNPWVGPTPALPTAARRPVG